MHKRTRHARAPKDMLCANGGARACCFCAVSEGNQGGMNRRKLEVTEIATAAPDGAEVAR